MPILLGSGAAPKAPHEEEAQRVLIDDREEMATMTWTGVTIACRPCDVTCYRFWTSRDRALATLAKVRAEWNALGRAHQEETTMTPTALAQIADRVKARPIQDLDHDAVQDRVLLLDLVRQIARSGFQTQNTDEDPVCFYCQNPIRYAVPTWEQIEAGAPMLPPPTIDHAADCPALILAALKTEDGP